jgi:hypothetical protein
MSKPDRGAAVARLVGVAWALVQYQWVFGLDLVLAKAPFWKSPYGDEVTNLAGAEAIWRAPWRWPPTVTHALLAGKPLSVVYTDSLPWLTLAFKALGLGHAHTLNLLGVFLLISYLLQPLGMIALMRALGERRAVPLAAGAILALLLPAWIARQFGHIALTGHFIITFALALAVGAAREGLTLRRTLSFLALAVFATGTHLYLLVPVGFAFAAALGAEWLQRGRSALPAVAGAGIVVAGAVGLSAWVLGYGVGLGVLGGAAAFGFYSMNLLQPVWPHPSALAGQHWQTNLGWFSGGDHFPPGQVFEGLNYLGAGALVVVLAAAVTGLVHLTRARPDWRQWLRRFGPLTLAMLLLALWAVGPHGYAGTLEVWKLTVPQGPIGDVLGAFRAHGRFFWAPAYLALAASLVWLAGRLPGRVFAVLAAGACLLQLADSSLILWGVHHRYATASWPITYPVQLDVPAIEGRPFVTVPRYWCTDDPKDQVTISQLSLVAMRRGGSIDSSNSARAQPDDCKMDPALLADAAPQDPRILAVIVSAPAEASRLGAYARRHDCVAYRRGLVCGRGVPALMAGLAGDPAPELRQPMIVPFDHGQNRMALTSGWSTSEEAFVWSDGPRAQIAALTPLVPEAGFRVTLQGHAFVEQGHPSTPVELWSGGRRLARWDAGFAEQRLTADLPAAGLMAGTPLPLELRFPEVHPGVAAAAHDGRQLGFAIERLEVAPRPPREGTTKKPRRRNDFFGL